MLPFLQLPMSIRFANAMLCTLFVALAIVPLASAEMTAESLLEAYVEKVDVMHADVASALAVFKKGKFADARKLLTKATTADPALPPAGILLTRMFIAADQLRLASAELEKVIAEHPSDPEGYLGIGEVAVSERRFAIADLALQKATDFAKTKKFSTYRQKKMLSRIRIASAALAEHHEDWATVSKYLQPIVDDDLDQPAVVSRLARSLFKQGKEEAAFRLLQKHYDSDKDSDNVRRPEISVAMLFQEDDNKKKAAQSIKLAAKRDPGSVATQSFVATWALEQGDFVLAQQCADKAFANSKSSIPSRLLVALVARYKGEHDVAKEVLESVHLESPANLSAMIELSIVLREMKGMENRALQYAQVATKLQPNLKLPAGRNAAMSLAWVLNKLGGQPQAEEIVRQVLAAGPLGVESSYFAAKIVLPGKNRAAAKQLLKSALNSELIFPGHDDAKNLYDNTVW